MANTFFSPSISSLHQENVEHAGPRKPGALLQSTRKAFQSREVNKTPSVKQSTATVKECQKKEVEEEFIDSIRPEMEIEGNNFYSKRLQEKWQ